MPNRQQRRANDPTLDKWLHVVDMDDNPFEIYMRDISGKDEYDFLLATQGQMGGLCDMFLEQKVTLVNIAGLIWVVRRKYEKKLTVMDVLRTVSMATLETMDMHDPDDDEEALESLPADDPNRKLAQIRKGQVAQADASEGMPGFADGTPPYGHDSAPSTT
jgi:hypothetical protein